jgi:hypothetical protein
MFKANQLYYIVLLPEMSLQKIPCHSFSIVYIFSGRGLSPGLYGSLLAGFEVPQGEYQVTVAFLDFISELVMVS